MNFPIMVLGFSAISLGLSFKAAVTAILLGSFVGAAVQGVLAQTGARLGVPQQIQARGPLGFFGNFVSVAYINVFAGIGWAAVTVILGSQAFHQLAPAVPMWICSLVLVSLQLVVAIYGYNMIHYLQKILAWVLFAGFLMITVVSIARSHGAVFGANPHAKYYVGAAGGWITFAGYFLSFLIAWWPFASDYSRYLPDTHKTHRDAGLWTWAGNFISLSWLGIAGVLLGAGAVAGESPIQALYRMTGEPDTQLGIRRLARRCRGIGPVLAAVLLHRPARQLAPGVGRRVLLRRIRRRRGALPAHLPAQAAVAAAAARPRPGGRAPGGALARTIG